MDMERRQAATEESSAAAARAAAVARGRQARTEAGRQLASARAKLETVRLAQAKLRATLLARRALLAARKAGFEAYRGELLRRVEVNAKGWPKTAPAYDALYQRTVAKLAALRPEALETLWASLRGLPDAPGEDQQLPAAVVKLGGERAEEVRALKSLAKKLSGAADRLAKEQRTVADATLEALVSETSALNRHRTKLLPKLSSDKRRAVTGIGREGIAQLLREVQQLVLDVSHWSVRRLRQIDEVPRLVLDIFTVGGTMWLVLQLCLLLWLLRFLLERWDGWLGALGPQVDRFVGLGRYNKPLTRLVDLLRHAGRPLVVLLCAALALRLVGGSRGAPTELQVLYILVFWIAIYRLQLRVVESLAKHVGLEKALKAAQTADEELLEEDPDLEGPPAPKSLRLAADLDEGESQRKVVPGPVLAVRSVRAATRYVLVVILLLELTALAVGHGTIYRMTARFSWLATVPFLIYFLRLWRPHIAAAYKARMEADAERQEGTLGRLIEGSKGRFYGVFIVGAAFGVVFVHKIASFARRYLTNLDATKKLLAFFFRRHVERRAVMAGQVKGEQEPLPEALLAHFPMGPLTPRDQPEVLAHWTSLEEAVTRWSTQRSDGSIALVGAAGVGKTTTLNLLQERLDPPLAIRRAKLSGKPIAPEAVVAMLAEVLELEGIEDEEGLVEAIRVTFPALPKGSEEEPREEGTGALPAPLPMVVLDDCHHLFLRHVGGFAGWKLFVRVVDATCDRLLWLLTFDQTAWDYLTNAAGRVHHFRRVIPLPLWDEGQLQELIIRRMRRARYRTSFSELMKVADLQGPDIRVQLERTKAGYFRMLWDASGGNPRVATLYWLRSLEVDHQRRLAQVRFFASPTIERLQELPEPYAFALAAIAEHGKMLAEELAKATNLSLDFCRSSLRVCLEEGLLEAEEDQRVKLSTSWQPMIKRFLKRKHMLRNV